MFNVWVGYRQYGGGAEWRESSFSVKKLEHVTVERVGVSVKVDIRDEAGKLLGYYCGPEIQVTILPAKV